MKKTGLLLLLIATAGWGQSSAQGAAADQTSPEGTVVTSASFPTVRFQTPTYADVYCAGFISKQTLPDANFVAGGLHTPGTTKFVKGDLVYLEGSGYTAGAQYAIVRALRDVNEYEMYPGEKKTLKATGQPYAEVGRVRIIDTRNSHSVVAQIEYDCDPVNPGDTAIPFAEKSTTSFRSPMHFDRFLPANNKLSGRIVMGKDFDATMGTGQKVYINVGANQGVKVGDYFRAVRPYWLDRDDEVDSISLKASVVEDTQQRPPSLEPAMFTKNSKGAVIHMTDFPRRAVGEMVVLSVTPTSSTAMVIFALEDLHLGDFAEME
jgi:hypothetical protein